MPSQSLGEATSASPGQAQQLAMFAKYQGLAIIVSEETLPTPLNFHDRQERDQAALMALWQACLDYSPDKGTPMAVIRWRVRSAMTTLRRSWGKPRRKRKREAIYLDAVRQAQARGHVEVRAIDLA